MPEMNPQTMLLILVGSVVVILFWLNGVSRNGRH